jgi:L-proline amide hydrolase
MANPEIYHTMAGPSEFHVTGTLKEWDIRDRLGEIQLPTLVTSGRYDEATPAIAETVHRGIVGSEWVIFEQTEFTRGSPGGGGGVPACGNDFMRRVEEGQA